MRCSARMDTDEQARYGSSFPAQRKKSSSKLRYSEGAKSTVSGFLKNVMADARETTGTETSARLWLDKLSGMKVDGYSIGELRQLPSDELIARAPAIMKYVEDVNSTSEDCKNALQLLNDMPPEATAPFVKAVAHRLTHQTFGVRLAALKVVSRLSVELQAWNIIAILRLCRDQETPVRELAMTTLTDDVLTSAVDSAVLRNDWVQIFRLSTHLPEEHAHKLRLTHLIEEHASVERRAMLESTDRTIVLLSTRYAVPLLLVDSHTGLTPLECSDFVKAFILGLPKPTFLSYGGREDPARRSRPCPP